METLQQALDAVHRRILTAERAYGREPGAVRLLAVSKTVPAERLREAFAAGQRCFAESYLQEAEPKIAALADLAIEWHFIGPLQSNKTRAVAEHFDWVHSVDRVRIARRLNDQRPPDRPPLNCCLQVNISGETSKSGVAPEAVVALARAILDCERLRLRGLMAIPLPEADVDRQRAAFARLRELQARCLHETGAPLDTLSMGMSGDLEAAIAEGATMVRVGTAIFGARPR